MKNQILNIEICRVFNYLHEDKIMKEIKMVEIDQDMKIEVALRDAIEGGEGNDSVQIAITGGEPHSGISLEPSQARALATEIIETVNRAEVKRKLKNRYPAHRQHRMG